MIEKTILNIVVQMNNENISPYNIRRNIRKISIGNRWRTHAVNRMISFVDNVCRKDSCCRSLFYPFCMLMAEREAVFACVFDYFNVWFFSIASSEQYSFENDITRILVAEWLEPWVHIRILVWSICQGIRNFENIDTERQS